MYGACQKSTYPLHYASTPASSQRLTLRRRPSARLFLDWFSSHPDLRRHLYNDDGKLRAFVNVYLNDEDVRYLEKDATAVQDSDSISIVPSIAGGR